LKESKETFEYTKIVPISFKGSGEKISQKQKKWNEIKIIGNDNRLL
jgi:hypothetical protein